jgi:hypothetical protein
VTLSRAQTRRFYVTPGLVSTAQVLTACSAGFHTASLWEILDPSSLRYETALGFTTADSGAGPPTNVNGAVRTGGPANSASLSPGTANCAAWTVELPSANGTFAKLTKDWGTSGSANKPLDPPWRLTTAVCSSSRVWCVED